MANKLNKLLAELQKSSGYKKYEIRHVKAHTNSVKARSKANQWCDTESRVHVTKKVKELKKDLVIDN